MDEQLATTLLKAIEKDNLKSFNSCMEKEPCGNYRYGRFPVLSLLYLYDATKILAIHEEKLLNYNFWTELKEPISVSEQFRKVAKKELRLFVDEIVTPVEMLMILDKNTTLKRVYPKFNSSTAVKQRLKSIYNLKYQLNVEFDNDKIIIDRRPRTRKEKQKLLLTALSCVLCVAIIVCTPFVINVFVPFIGVSPTESDNSSGDDSSTPTNFDVDTYEDINFTSNNTYYLKSDIVFPKNFSFDRANCNIVGEGHTLTFADANASIESFTGKLQNVTINSDGKRPIFTSIQKDSVISDVVINIDTDMEITDHYAFLVNYNYGKLQNITLNLSGKVNVNDSTSTETFIGGMVLVNGASGYDYGTVENCTVNYDDFNIKGVATANASFGGIVGVNYCKIISCAVNGKITSDTVDLAGVCVTNNNNISSTKNSALLTQVSETDTWYPLVAGIALNNYYRIISCQNEGDINVISTLEQSSVSIAGIANTNSHAVEFCQNSGLLSVSAQKETAVLVGGIVSDARGYIAKSKNTGGISVVAEDTIYAGGISARSIVPISNCFSSGDITVKGKEIYVGGILGIADFAQDYFSVYLGAVSASISNSKISSSCVGENSFGVVGGIVGLLVQVTVPAETPYYIGGYTIDSFFLGSLQQNENTYVGSIVGSAGKNIMQQNSFTLGNTVYPIMQSNFACDETFKSLGSQYYDEENKERTFGEGLIIGTTIATKEELEQNKNYQNILNNLTQQ